jgi:DNA-binding NarL/FixJ family response regulator
VIMFSGKVDEGQLAEATKHGASGVLGKGFDPQELIESAKRALPIEAG